MKQKLEFIPEKEPMQLAIELAKKAALSGDVPVGAVIEKGGKIIGMGRNRREEKQNALCHAEIEAIDDACRRLGTWRLSGCRLYVTLEPCAMCAGAILNARIERVIYGAEDVKLPLGALDIWQNAGLGQVQLYRNFMQEDCQALLKDFFEGLR